MNAQIVLTVLNMMKTPGDRKSADAAGSSEKLRTLNNVLLNGNIACLLTEISASFGYERAAAYGALYKRGWDHC